MRDRYKASCDTIVKAAENQLSGFHFNGPKPHFDAENLVGTARMGDDPSRSALNRFNRTHDVKNLWVLDGASFTSYCEKRPTLTVVAVAIRASDHLVEAVKAMETQFLPLSG